MTGQLMDGEAVRRAIRRIAHEISERHPQGQVALIGIQTRGVPLAHRLAKEFAQIEPGQTLPVGSLDISFHRDDLAKTIPVPKGSEVLFDVKDKTVILVDDVLYTGRTIRAALDALLDFGRPAKVELCVLIDRRFSRQLPIQPDYIGKAIDSIISQKVKVFWKGKDGKDEVALMEGA